MDDGGHDCHDGHWDGLLQSAVLQLLPGGMSMKTGSLLLPAATIMVVALLFAPGYATDYSGTTESASNQYDVLYITLALGQDQYQEIDSNNVEYHTETVITGAGRTTKYIIHSNADPITVSGDSVSVCLIATFDLAIGAPGDLPEYDLSMVCNSGSVSSDFTYYLAWEDTAPQGSSGVMTFQDTDLTSTGIEIEGLQCASLRLYIYVGAGELEGADEPTGKVFNDAVLTFSVQAEES